MQESSPGAWRCLAHDPDSPEWKAAIAMGAWPPCRIPEKAGDRREMAEMKSLDPGTAELLARDLSEHVRRILAANQHAPSPALKWLAEDPDTNVRRRVANNPNTPGPVLERLAGDPVWLVRQGVARNPSTPTLALQQLIKDPDKRVRSHAQELLRSRTGKAAS